MEPSQRTPPMAGLDGRVVVVTGAAGGIGTSAARAFAACGAHLVLGDVAAEAGERLAEELRRAGRAAVFVPCDVTEPTEVIRLAGAAVEHFGGVHSLFHVAGASGRRHGDGAAHLATCEGWDWTMNVNLRSAFLCARAVLPHLLEAGGGAITFLSSVQALAGGGKHFDAVAYAAAKTGLLGLTRAMATYYADAGIRVNAICAGTVDTPMAARVRDDEALAAHVARMQPLTGGPGTPEDVANAAVFLASDHARFVTGVAFPVDGGWSAA